MSEIFLTPASIGYLTQIILSSAITIILIRRLKFRTAQAVYLTGFFGMTTFFIGLLFLDAVLPPHLRLRAVYMENTALALTLLFLIQFAYRFPQSYPQYKWISRASLLACLLYAGTEGGYMVNRYIALLANNRAYYRTGKMDFFTAFILLLAPIAFALQCIAADPRKVHWLKKLIHPQGKNAQGARFFIFNFAILFLLGIINVLRTYNVLSTAVYNASLSIGMLLALWMFATNYINFIPGGVSIQVKLSILSLTFFLALFGTISWIISPAYISTFQPHLISHQTLRFTPNKAGGYAVTEETYSFHNELGRQVLTSSIDKDDDFHILYPFTFYGEQYQDLFASYPGVISMGRPFWQPNLQAQSSYLPAIYPLMLDLDPNAGGGLFVNEAPDRLIVTWYQLPARYNHHEIYTFQVVLYKDGVFDLTYRDLPVPVTFMADETPSANPWIRGITPGKGENLHFGDSRLPKTYPQHGNSIIENYQLEFRRYLHHFMLPLMWVVVGGSLLLVLLFPLLLRYSISNPMNNLMAGIRKIERGNFDISLSVYNEDEFGVLTQHFNKMTTRLNGMVTELEKRVDERTVELSEANESLRSRLWEINQLQAKLKEQSIRDPLTNAFNRRYLIDSMDKELSRSKREHVTCSLIMIDVDHFKKFNDTFGHQAGDLILQQIVQLVQVHIRKEDTICRLGGDEFIILLPKASLEDAAGIAEKLRGACENLQATYKNHLVNITISLGVASNHPETENAEELLTCVDEALYKAKKSGRNCVRLSEHP